MIAFLTSSPCLEDGTLNPANGFADALRAALPSPCRGLFICSSPDEPGANDHYSALMRESLERGGIRFSDYAVLDRRNQAEAPALVRGAGLIVLAGGHVPTQNRFFREIGLKELLSGWNGAMIGISAGTMNSAETVYAHPELPGEAVDPEYRRFLSGLGLTKAMVLPHVQSWRHDTLDGLRLIEDIALPDSMGRCFYALPDGSWLRVEDGAAELRGEAWRIADGAMAQVCWDGETLAL